MSKARMAGGVPYVFAEPPSQPFSSQRDEIFSAFWQYVQTDRGQCEE